MFWKLAWALGTDLASQPDALITRQLAICSTNRILATCQQNSKLNHITRFRHGGINAKFHALRTSARNKGDSRYHLLFIAGKLVCPCSKKRVRRYGHTGEKENPERIGMQCDVSNLLFYRAAGKSLARPLMVRIFRLMLVLLYTGCPRGNGQNFGRVFSVPYVELYRYNPKHLYPKLNGYGDNGQRSLKL